MARRKVPTPLLKQFNKSISPTGALPSGFFLRSDRIMCGYFFFFFLPPLFFFGCRLAYLFLHCLYCILGSFFHSFSGLVSLFGNILSSLTHFLFNCFSGLLCLFGSLFLYSFRLCGYFAALGLDYLRNGNFFPSAAYSGSPALLAHFSEFTLLYHYHDCSFCRI